MQEGYAVSHLSRSKQPSLEGVDVIQWDVKNGDLEAAAIEAFEHIIHLAGTGIVDKAWTDERIREIEESRTKSAKLIIDAVEKNQKKPVSFVSASAVGYYGFQTSEHVYKEADEPADDVIAETCIAWEKQVDEMQQLGVPTAKIRIGLVLSEKGGALKEMAKPFKLGFGAALGSGKQYMPWVHIDDLCRLFIKAMEEKWTGVYNGAAPNQVNNQQFSKVLAKTLHKPFFLPNVPAFVMRMILGSRARLVLEGSRVSTKKVQEKGFDFTYHKLEEALRDIYR